MPGTIALGGLAPWRRRIAGARGDDPRDVVARIRPTPTPPANRMLDFLIMLIRGRKPGARDDRSPGWGVLALLVVALSSAMPGPLPAQPGWVLRPFTGPERPSLLDDGDLDSLRAAVERSLGWLDRQPPGRWLVF